MSGGPSGFRWLLWALRVQSRPVGAHALTPREHQVLLALARHANPDSHAWPKSARRPNGADAAAWPSRRVVEVFCRCGHNAVNEALRGLEAHGLMVAQRRPNASTVYWFLESWLSEPSDDRCDACSRQLDSESRRTAPRKRLSERSEVPSSERSEVPSSERSDAEVAVNSQPELLGRTGSPWEEAEGAGEGDGPRSTPPSNGLTEWATRHVPELPLDLVADAYRRIRVADLTPTAQDVRHVVANGFDSWLADVGGEAA